MPRLIHASMSTGSFAPLPQELQPLLLVQRDGKAAQTVDRHGILAAVDASISAASVASTAAKIARQCGLPLAIISIASHEALRAEAEHALAHALAVAEAAGTRATGRILSGKPFQQILEAAKLPNADLIVIGRHGESDLIRTPFGSTTQKVLGLSEIPVLVVHPALPESAAI